MIVPMQLKKSLKHRIERPGRGLYDRGDSPYMIYVSMSFLLLYLRKGINAPTT